MYGCTYSQPWMALDDVNSELHARSLYTLANHAFRPTRGHERKDRPVVPGDTTAAAVWVALSCCRITPRDRSFVWVAEATLRRLPIEE